MIFQDVKVLVERIIKQTEVTIALKTLCRRLNEDDRIADTYNDTYEAHGFVLTRHAVDYAFALGLTRMNAHSVHRLTPSYRTVEDTGVDNDDDRFTVEVVVGEDCWGRGVGRTKRAAEMAAATAALARDGARP